MQAIIKAVKRVSFLQTCLLVALATVSFNVFAHHHCYRNYVYVGNPTRPNTIWVPMQCGCARDGYFIKYIDEPTCADVYWNCDRWQPRAYRVVGSR